MNYRRYVLPCMRPKGYEKDGIRLFQLPEELIQRILIHILSDKNVLNAASLRNIWNVCTTCKRLHELMNKAMLNVQASRLLTEYNVPYDLVDGIRLPNDVVQGTLMALRLGSSAICEVRLGRMNTDQLQTVLQFLRNSRTLKELSFIDTAYGVEVPEAVCGRLESLSIVSPHTRTIRSLYRGRCEPSKLYFLRCSDSKSVAVNLRKAWIRITRRCKAIDLTQKPSRLGEWEMPFTDSQRESMCIRRKEGLAKFEVRHTLSMRAISDMEMEGGRFYSFTSEISHWLSGSLDVRFQHHDTRVLPPYQNALNGNENVNNSALVVLHGELSEDEASEDEFIEDASLKWECGSFCEISSAHTLLNCNDGNLVQQFVDEVLDRKSIYTLLVTTPLKCTKESAWIAAQAAARVAAATDKVCVLAVSAAVFAALKHVRLPPVVENVGVVDEYVTSDFLKELPGALRTLTRAKAVRSVWVNDVPLLDSDLGEWALKRAEQACHRAEARGLCAAGVRGMIEKWMREA